MALWSDPRFSTSNRRFAEPRVDDAYERRGLGFGLTLILTVAFALLVFGAVEGLGFFDFGDSQIADRTLDHPVTPHDPSQIPRELVPR